MTALLSSPAVARRPRVRVGGPSLFERALGPAFEGLHPMVRRRFGFGSASGLACIGRGVMEEVWHGPAWTLPFLWVGSARHVLFPERGRGVPFTIENYAFRDALGRETLSIARTFRLPRRARRFDAWMVWSEERGCIVDYLGTHQHLAVDLAVSVAEGGALSIRSGAQRIHEGPLSFAVPPLLTGDAEVVERYDEAERCFRIEVRVTSPRFGPLFGYRGRFEAEWIRCASGAVPRGVMPRRVEPRA